MSLQQTIVDKRLQRQQRANAERQSREAQLQETVRKVATSALPLLDQLKQNNMEELVAMVERVRQVMSGNIRKVKLPEEMIRIREVSRELDDNGNYSRCLPVLYLFVIHNFVRDIHSASLPFVRMDFLSDAFSFSSCSSLAAAL